MIVDQDILCALCRSAMWQQPCDLDLTPGISDEQWQRIYMNSVRHGVLALALDGVMRLPKELQPGFNTRIKWGYNAEVIAKRYNAQKATAEKLAAIFAEKGIRTMVMKGIGLSLYYPLPRQRPFGDIDIYLFDKFDEGNRIMSKYGCDVDGSYYRVRIRRIQYREPQLFCRDSYKRHQQVYRVRTPGNGFGRPHRPFAQRHFAALTGL